MTRRQSQRNVKHTRDTRKNADEDTDLSGTQVECCGTCAQTVGDQCIGCDKCERWVHGTEMCSGLPQKVIDAILEYSGEGISYMCMQCRVTRASNTSHSGSPASRSQSENFMADTLGQLFQQIRGMSTILANLTKEVKAIASQRTPSSTEIPLPEAAPALAQTQSAQPILSQPPKPFVGGHSPPTTSLDQHRLFIREELREMHERDKRRDSIIIRGLKSDSPNGIVNEFADLSNKKMGARILLTDVVMIPKHTGICRAKISNPDERQLVLDRAKNLRNTEFQHVYIRKDLTYAQRGELKMKREANPSRKDPEEGKPGESRGPKSTQSVADQSAAPVASPPPDEKSSQAPADAGGATPRSESEGGQATNAPQTPMAPGMGEVQPAVSGRSN